MMIRIHQIQGFLGNFQLLLDDPTLTGLSASQQSVVMSAGSLVWVTGKSTASQNGPYVFDGTDLVRPTIQRAITSGESVILGSEFLIVSGTYAGKKYRVTTVGGGADSYGIVRAVIDSDVIEVTEATGGAGGSVQATQLEAGVDAEIVGTKNGANTDFLINLDTVFVSYVTVNSVVQDLKTSGETGGDYTYDSGTKTISFVVAPQGGDDVFIGIVTSGAIDEDHYKAPLQDTTALSALLEANLTDEERRFVKDEVSDYFYDSAAVSGDIAPDDQTSGTGFWKKAAAGTGMSALTYDPNTVAGDAFDMDNMAEGATTKILTDTERAAISSATSHAANSSNPHSVTKSQVGLGSVDNTADADKPISTVQQTALNLKANSADLGTAAAAATGDFLASGTKLDDLGVPDDNTDLDATSSAHGLLPKLSGTASEYLNGTGGFSTPAGGGDVVGPASATTNGVALFNGTMGKLIQDSGLTFAANGLLSGASGFVIGAGTNASAIEITNTTTFLKSPDGNTTLDVINGRFYLFENSGSNTLELGSTGLELNGTNPITGIIDDDTMATASATTLATSESIVAYIASVGGGDMTLASAQTNTGAKTFADTTLLLRNVAGTFNGSFINTNTADRIYTLQDAAGTLAFTSDVITTLAGLDTTVTGSQLNTIKSTVDGLGTASTAATDDFAAALGVDDNYVTDAEKVVIGNTSNTNTGDQDLSGLQPKPTEGQFVDGDKTKLDGIEALADVTDTANVTASGALMDSEVTNLADVKAFDPGDYQSSTAPFWQEVVLTASTADIAAGNGVAYLTHTVAGTITGFKIICDPANEPSAAAVQVDLNSIDLSTGAATTRLSAVAQIATSANISTGGTISGTQTVAFGDQSSFDIDQGSDGKELRALVQITPS